MGPYSWKLLHEATSAVKGLSITIPTMENQMEKSKENDMKTGVV